MPISFARKRDDESYGFVILLVLMNGGSGNVLSTNSMIMYAKASIFRAALTALLASLFMSGHARAAEGEATLRSEDQGRRSWVVDIETLTLENSHDRAAKWTGTSLEMTVMSIPPGGDGAIRG